MLQNVLVILIVAAAVLYAVRQLVRFFAPKLTPGKPCGGSCCSGSQPDARPASATGPRTQMISSDALRARIAARQR
jgi:hypothetical protein